MFDNFLDTFAEFMYNRNKQNQKKKILFYQMSNDFFLGGGWGVDGLAVILVGRSERRNKQYFNLCLVKLRSVFPDHA
jgi:hypothetical protein